MAKGRSGNMPFKYRAIVASAFLLFLLWLLFAAIWAGRTAWDYERLSHNAEYWGGIVQSGSSLLAAALLLVALLMQRDELGEQREQIASASEDAKAAQRIALEQSQQIRRQAEIAQQSAEVGRLMPLLELRCTLMAAYYEQKGRTDTNMLKEQLARIDDALAAFVVDAKVDEQTRDILCRLTGRLSIDERTIRETRPSM